MPPVFLSVVIPAYNEQARIIGTLEQVLDFLNAWDRTWEVVIADDGSTDDTARLIDHFAANSPGAVSYTHLRAHET